VMVVVDGYVVVDRLWFGFWIWGLCYLSHSTLSPPFPPAVRNSVYVTVAGYVKVVIVVVRRLWFSIAVHVVD